MVEPRSIPNDNMLGLFLARAKHRRKLAITLGYHLCDSFCVFEERKAKHVAPPQIPKSSAMTISGSTPSSWTMSLTQVSMMGGPQR